MEHEQKLYAAKTVPWPGATPFFPPVCGPKSPAGLRGSRPATMHALRSRVRCFAAPEDSRSGFKPSAGIASLQSTIYRLMRHLSYFAKEISDTKATCSTRCTRTGPPKDPPQPRSRPSSTPVRSDKRWPLRPIFCPSLTTFSTTFLSTKAGAEVDRAWKRSFHQ